MGIVEPAAHRDRVIRVEDIARRAVIQDQDVRDGPAELREVLNVGRATVEVAGLAEEAVVHDVVDVEFVEDGVCVLCHSNQLPCLCLIN
jgi:hypothetical protein